MSLCAPFSQIKCSRAHRPVAAQSWCQPQLTPWCSVSPWPRHYVIIEGNQSPHAHIYSDVTGNLDLPGHTHGSRLECIHVVPYSHFLAIVPLMSAGSGCGYSPPWDRRSHNPSRLCQLMWHGGGRRLKGLVYVVSPGPTNSEEG